ncbi:MAG: CoF synthetase [Candidatus Berkelbacteria bacterium]|nr:CoF synthetase [Candidatus Berkelbacteria bacterium]
MRARLKSIAETVTPNIGKHLSHVPFSLRLGAKYRSSVRDIAAWENASREFDDSYFKSLQALVRFAFENIDFYREFYKQKGFSPDDLSSMSDWSSVPIVTKTDFQSAPLESRCRQKPRGMKINTGGTSGQPLEFYIAPGAFAVEWAHMHYIWKLHGYKPQHLKITFRGKHFDSAEPLRYNAVHNEYIVNASAPMSQVTAAILELSKGCVIRWLHGYPSLIAEFARQIEGGCFPGFSKFRARLFGVLLGSEYPAPAYRSVIERVISTHVVSWYGHSEMAILARETALGVYESLPTYGYAEAVLAAEGGFNRLIGTSLHNRVHPFIRYDTGDLVQEVSKQSMSLGFQISEGRVGDFIVDRQGNRHSLTAIIFGRHHDAFDLINHVQVRDQGGGVITLVITPRNTEVAMSELAQGFNLVDLDMEFQYEVVDSPIRTKAGKIQLKI